MPFYIQVLEFIQKNPATIQEVERGMSGNSCARTGTKEEVKLALWKLQRLEKIMFIDDRFMA